MDNLLKGLYQNKKVLITGNTGFKGSWLSLWLNELGANVIGYSLDPPTKPNLFESTNLSKKIKTIYGDVRDEKHLVSTFKKYKPEFVFHLAAQPLVMASYSDPKYTYETNVMGTVNILEAIRKTKGVRVCVVVTSDKCYENKEWVYGYRENDPMGGYDPYSSSKGCAELVTNAYRQSFFNPEEYEKTHNLVLSSVRAGNVIGGGDWGKNRLLPDCIKAISSKKKITIRNPYAIRPWQYVLDPLHGYLLLGAMMYGHGAKYGGAWNFGPENENTITVEELVRLAIGCWGSGSYVVDRTCHPHEASLLKLDTTKARTLLGWKSIYGIQKTIERAVDWYKNFYSGMQAEKAYEMTRNEILDYMR